MSTSTSESKKLIAAIELTESQYHRLLTNERRRLALDVLTDVGTPSTLSEVATEVAAREQAASGRPEPDVAGVRTMLHHAHLPLMDDFEVIDYKPDEHRIEAGQTSIDLLTE